MLFVELSRTKFLGEYQIIRLAYIKFLYRNLFIISSGILDANHATTHCFTSKGFEIIIMLLIKKSEKNLHSEKIATELFSVLTDNTD